MLKLSKRVTTIKESKTLAINTKAKGIAATGEKVYNFAVGEPDINPPAILIKEIEKAFNKGFTKYTPPSGLPEAKEKIAKHLGTQMAFSFTKDNIALSCGGKHSLYNVFQAIIGTNDEVIIPRPYWVSYPEQITLSGGKPIFVNSTKDLQLDVKAIANSITRRTKAIVLNSPNNPTGVVFKKEVLTQLAKLLEKKDIFIISDDVYQTLVYTKKPYHIAHYSKNIREKTIIVDSYSKSLAMTGLRLGIVAASKEIVSAIDKLQGQTCGNPTSIIQMGVANTLGRVKTYQKEYLALFTKRRKIVLALLEKNSLISYPTPDGGFYVFINIKKISNDSFDFCEKLLKKHHVALVPGKAFGQEGFVRISFASNVTDLKEGIKRFNTFCKEESKIIY
ncbi:pyridoxal phosphate-dependent aminotransferase [Patescibacteria group bacterium]|nr:pyridoxal phosphate-dependent aminotransferase [Patescibacteria group bacterium]